MDDMLRLLPRGVRRKKWRSCLLRTLWNESTMKIGILNFLKICFGNKGEHCGRVGANNMAAWHSESPRKNAKNELAFNIRPTF
jgi:hypothetical protein